MARFFRRRKFCRFTAEGTKEIDYKDLETLKRVSLIGTGAPGAADGFGQPHRLNHPDVCGKTSGVLREGSSLAGF